MTQGGESTFPKFEMKIVPLANSAQGYYKCSFSHEIFGGESETISNAWNTNKDVPVSLSMALVLTAILCKVLMSFA